MIEIERDFEILPVLEFRGLISKALTENKVFICISETGSGKTTQIPQFCLDDKFVGSGMVAVTQPRRVAAITVAQRVSEERKCRLGEEVGYAVRFDDCTSSKTRIKYMTDGVLLRECLSDPLLSKYDIVMLDEAHERSINTDILFGLVKAAIAKRNDLRVIVTSATLDVEKFSSYFNNCPVLTIPGRVYPVDIYHSKTRQVMTVSGPANNGYISAAVDSVMNIHRGDEEGHILVFLTGQEEVERACAMIRERIKEEENLTGRPLIVLPLYAALPADQQRLVFKKLDSDNILKPTRKCIVATNIAETSITVPHVRFVVDCGYAKQKTFDPARAIESLLIVPISQVSSDQRAGRAGRTAPGACYRLYSSECYEKMLPETIPEIMRTSLGSTVLYLKALGVTDALNFDFIQSPAPEQICEALVLLHMLGALDNLGNITDIGKMMSKLPLYPPVAKMVLSASGSECDCVPEIVAIAAMLSIEPPFLRPARRTGIESDRRLEMIQASLCHPMGDHHTFLRLYRQYLDAGRRGESGQYDWCRQNYISIRAMREAHRIRDQLWTEVKNMKLDSSSNHKHSKERRSEDIRIAEAIASGIYMRAARICSGNDTIYRSLPFLIATFDREKSGLQGAKIERESEVMLLHPAPGTTLSISLHHPPDHVVYQDLVFGGRANMRHICAVDVMTLERLRAQYLPASPQQLCGYPSVPDISVPDNHKRKIDDVVSEEDISHTVKDPLPSVSITSARERYLARKTRYTNLPAKK